MKTIKSRYYLFLLLCFFISSCNFSNYGSSKEYSEAKHESNEKENDRDVESGEYESINEDEEGVEEEEDDDDDDLEEQEDEENFPDDIYCAEVDFYNPNTGTSSSYTLTIEVENNEVIKINFPRGWLDEDDFSSSELDSYGETEFTSIRGYDYEVKIIGKEFGCFINVPKAVQCRGITDEDEQCENLTDNLNGLCWRHQDQD